LRGLSTKELVSVAARFRLAGDPTDVPTATKFALRSVARRYEALSAEIAELDVHLGRLVGQVAPELVALPGIGNEKFEFEVEGTHRRLAFRDGEYVDAYSMARLKA
jgi:transposase